MASSQARRVREATSAPTGSSMAGHGRDVGSRRQYRSARPCFHFIQPSHTLDRMPQLTVEGAGTFEVPQGKRLVLALEDEAKIDQMHACGGNARCTTCRVQFLAGEPQTM